MAAARPRSELRRAVRALVVGALAATAVGVFAFLARRISSRCGEPTWRDCVRLGGAIGDGTSPVRDTAGRWLHEIACGAGDLRSCTNLALHYDKGWGVAKDQARSVALLERACSGGDLRGCDDLGISYEEGRGVPADVRRAIELYRFACERGDPSGCGNLADDYERGYGVPYDVHRAIELYARACEGGWEDGCTRLGGVFERGDGVPTDRDAAIAWFRRGCAWRDARACDGVTRLGATP
jgi:TPR repeat protein